MLTIHPVLICMLILQDSMECIIETYYVRCWLPDNHDISIDQYHTLRLAKENTTAQTKSNSHFRLVRSILIKIPTFDIPEAESLVSQIVTSLHKIKDVFIVLTSRMTDSQIVYSCTV